MTNSKRSSSDQISAAAFWNNGVSATVRKFGEYGNAVFKAMDYKLRNSTKRALFDYKFSRNVTERRFV